MGSSCGGPDPASSRGRRVRAHRFGAGEERKGAARWRRSRGRRSGGRRGEGEGRAPEEEQGLPHRERAAPGGGCRTLRRPPPLPELASSAVAAGARAAQSAAAAEARAAPGARCRQGALPVRRRRSSPRRCSSLPVRGEQRGEGRGGRGGAARPGRRGEGRGGEESRGGEATRQEWRAGGAAVDLREER